MLYPDLTEIFFSYCDWDDLVRNKYLRYAAMLMKKHTKVLYKGLEYHNVSDLRVDLKAECNEIEVSE